jgi:hypothetical protein
MTFTWLNKQGVRSDEGFELQRLSRFTMQYSERGNTLTIDLESGLINGELGILMRPDAAARWDDGSVSDLATQKRVIRNIREALRFQGLGLGLE